MPDLTPERLARLRTWATRHDANRPHLTRPHLYDGSCPWCRGDDIEAGAHDGYFDGNAHDVAIELLDEIERLRSGAGPVQEPATVHLCPQSGSTAMACCGRTPFEVPPTDRMTLAPSAVTCNATPGTASRPDTEPDKVVDLLGALERSLAAAKAGRERLQQEPVVDIDAAKAAWAKREWTEPYNRGFDIR